MTIGSWKVLASHDAFDHHRYVVRRDTVQLPDGTVDDYFLSVRPDVVVVVAVDRASGLEVLLMPIAKVAQALDDGDIAAMSSVAAGYRAMRRLLPPR